MTNYYYLKNSKSEFGYTPVPEDEYVQTIVRIAKKKGVKIMDGMILNELENKKRNNRGYFL